MKIERATNSNNPTSTVTVDDQPLFTMGNHHSMLALLGNRSNDLVFGAHYGDDYLVRDAPGGTVVGRWFVERYGWRRFWPPGATLPRVERLVRALRARAERAQAALVAMTKRVVADASLPRRGYVLNRTEERSEVVVCGRNRHGNDLKYAVGSEGDGGYSVGSNRDLVGRTPLGDEFARAADRSHGAWARYRTLCHVFRDAVTARLLADGRGLGVHRLVVGEHEYWFRLFKKVDRFTNRYDIESLDEHGSAAVTETVA